MGGSGVQAAHWGAQGARAAKQKRGHEDERGGAAAALFYDGGRARPGRRRCNNGGWGERHGDGRGAAAGAPARKACLDARKRTPAAGPLAKRARLRARGGNGRAPGWGRRLGWGRRAAERSRTHAHQTGAAELRRAVRRRGERAQGVPSQVLLGARGRRAPQTDGRRGERQSAGGRLPRGARRPGLVLQAPGRLTTQGPTFG
ncbi:MAG: hypothetical protein J3K34DRAFT_444194 [Monoraphidium minutum]|nr:MAG: hypothetical protein J3K34DRAFT_444194 [Monoraphidium minutum]